MADERPPENFADGSDDSGLSGNPDRPKRAPPTLDLDAVSVSDEAPAADAPVDQIESAAPRRSGIISSAIVSIVFGGGAAALVLAAVWWTGWLAPAPAVPPATPVNTAATDALAARVAKIEASVKTPAAPVTDPAIVARLVVTEKSLEAVRAELAAALARSEQLAGSINEIKAVPHDTPPPSPAPPPVDLAPINDRLAQIESATKANSAEIAKRTAPPPTSDLPLRRVVAAALLEMSVRQSEPYAPALAAAKPLAPNAEVLKPLESFAVVGVPDVNVMSRELLALFSKLNPPAQEHSATGSIVDRLEAGAARLIRIQRTDVPLGSDRNAILARASAAAQRNDVAEARRELNTLPPPDRAAVQPWIDKADARDAALSASHQFSADTMAALSKPAP